MASRPARAPLNYCTLRVALAVLAGVAWALAVGAQSLEEPTGYFAAHSLHLNYSGQVSFAQYLAYSMRALALVAGYDNDLHRYDDPQQLVDSFERHHHHQAQASSARKSSGQSPSLATNTLAPAALPYDSAEFELLHAQTDATLIENELQQAECGRQLDFMFEQSLQLYRDYDSYATSRRLDLIDLLDSWGSAPSEQLLMGHALWLGSFQQCERARVRLPAAAGSGRARQLEGRYCLASLRLPAVGRGEAVEVSTNKSEPRAERLGNDAIKLAVCLPRACNSISVLRHAGRLEALVKLVRLQQVPYSSARLATLYCLPDEKSPLRQLSPSARLFVGALALWLALVLSASVRVEWAHAKRRLQLTISNQATECQPEAEASKFEQIFAFRLAWRRLFGATQGRPSTSGSRHQHQGRSGERLEANLREATLAPAAESKSFAANAVAVPIRVAPRSQQEAPAESAPARRKTSGGAHANQLAIVDGLKVISMVWLVSAHTMLFFIRHISNGRDFWALVLDARFTTIMAGIFPVDSFFTITGLLTAYLKFTSTSTSTSTSASGARPFARPAYWLETFAHRYFRFMPMYLLVFWYTRDVSEYIGSGPMWDYATASSSLRSVCKRESLLVPMLFQANFKPIDQHCVKPAWYLANDYQYLLVTPLFMLLLLSSRLLGYLAIGASVAASLALQFLTVYYPADGHFADFEGLLNFRPMFAAYVLKDLWRLYVLPHNRVPPYLIGLLTGHLMYRFERRQQQHRQQATCGSTESLTSISTLTVSSLDSQKPASKGPGCSPAQSPPVAGPRQSQNIGHLRVLATLFTHHINATVWLPLAGLLAVIYLPLASKVLAPQTGHSARIGASLIIALMRLVWSLSIARLIYVCFVSTADCHGHSDARKGHNPPSNGSFVIDFLCSTKWRPWSKIGLSVLLIQWEIIGYVAQIQTSLPFMSIGFLVAVVLVCVVASYVLGLLVYLIFEYPLAQIEHLYIRPQLFAKKPPKCASI